VVRVVPGLTGSSHCCLIIIGWNANAAGWAAVNLIWEYFSATVDRPNTSDISAWVTPFMSIVPLISAGVMVASFLWPKRKALSVLMLLAVWSNTKALSHLVGIAGSHMTTCCGIVVVE